MAESMELVSIIGTIAAFVVGILLAFAPLFIWHHVAKMRAEVRERMAELMETLVAQTREMKKSNALSVEMQQRYLKTMQYVCDRLADICDHMDMESQDSQS